MKLWAGPNGGALVDAQGRPFDCEVCPPQCGSGSSGSAPWPPNCTACANQISGTLICDLGEGGWKLGPCPPGAGNSCEDVKGQFQLLACPNVDCAWEIQIWNWCCAWKAAMYSTWDLIIRAIVGGPPNYQWTVSLGLYRTRLSQSPPCQESRSVYYGCNFARDYEHHQPNPAYAAGWHSPATTHTDCRASLGAMAKISADYHAGITQMCAGVYAPYYDYHLPDPITLTEG
jgi:hypothetical protein